MDVEISQSARGSNDLALGPPAPVVYGQDLVQAPAYEIAVAETPDKSRLKKQVSDLVEALNYEENMVHAKIHEVKLDAGTKVRQILKDQQDNFKRVATEYEQYSRDMCEKEVAEARADVHGQAISAINDRERKLAEEHVRLGQLKDDLAKAHSAVGTEASQKAQIIAEAEDAIQRQRSEIINQAEQSMQEQNTLISRRLSELSEEARTETNALALERRIRSQAQGDLQRVGMQLFGGESSGCSYGWPEASPGRSRLRKSRINPRATGITSCLP